jgi:16S rRNA U1498 N3-methylase RsmE
MNMKAQDLGANLSDNNSQNIEIRLEAVKQMIRDQVPKIEDEVSTARAEKEWDDKAEVLLAKTAEDHIATNDQQAVERNVEQHLDTAREEMKKDEELEARRAGTSRKSEDMPQPSKR